MLSFPFGTISFVVSFAFLTASTIDQIFTPKGASTASNIPTFATSVIIAYNNYTVFPQNFNPRQ